MSKELNERDKPFILALVSSGTAILNIIIAAYGAYTNNGSMTETGLECLKFTFPLTTMSWAYYFKK